MEQRPPTSFGVPRRLVHVRHWRCGRLSERLRAAADALQEHDVATPIEVEVAWNPAHEPDRPDLPLSFGSASSLMSSTGAYARNAWVQWFNF